MANRQVCCICGERQASTRDHVPPKGVFAKPYPKNLITVPACRLCNNSACGADEQFRTYLGMMVDQENPRARALWRNHSLRTLRKNMKLFRAVTEGMGKVPVYTEGGVYLGERLAFAWPAHVYEPIIEKVARALFYHHIGRILGSDAVCEVGFLYSLPKDLVQFTSSFPQVQIGEGDFTYRYGHDPEHPYNSVWIFEFYKSHWAFAETKPSRPN